MFYENELRKCLYLVDKSRECHHYEPAIDYERHYWQQNMIWRLMDRIIECETDIETIRDEIDIQRRTLDARIAAVKLRAKEEKWNNRPEI